MTNSTAQKLPPLATPSLKKGIITVGVSALVVNLGAVVREVVVASIYGVSDDVDAFILAMVIPLTVINIVAGALEVSITPRYVAVSQTRPRQTASFFTSMICYSVVLGCGTGIALVASSPIIKLVAGGFSDSKVQTTISLFLIAIPIVVSRCVLTTFNVVLQANRHFAMATLAPGIVYVAAIVSSLLAINNRSINYLAIGTTIGHVLHLGLIVILVNYVGMLVIEKPMITFDVKQTLRQHASVAFGSAFMALTMVVDQTMAASLEPGSVAMLGYGSKITSFAIGIAAVAVSTVVLPEFSRQTARKEWRQATLTMKKAIQTISLISIPATLTLIFFSEPIIKIMFERGAFTTESTKSVAWIHSCYIVQVPFYLVGIVAVRMLNSLELNRLLIANGIINFCVNIAGNYVLISVFGVAGIAISTTIVYAVASVVNCTFAYHFLNKRQKADDAKPAVRPH